MSIETTQLPQLVKANVVEIKATKSPNWMQAIFSDTEIETDTEILVLMYKPKFIKINDAPKHQARLAKAVKDGKVYTLKTEEE